jgi:hypothetical protein
MAQGDFESSEALIQYLEQVSGRALRSREDIRRYLDEVSRSSGPRRSLLHTLKQGMWLTLLAVAYLQYYFLDVLNRIENMPEVRVNLPMTKLYGKERPRI